MTTRAQELIGFAETHVLDGQPLTSWQRRVFEQLFREEAGRAE